MMMQSDIFILSSHFEGLPMALLGTMPIGIVPVVNDVGSIKSVVQHGINGIIDNCDRNISILRKASQKKKVQLLFLSNMLEKKGPLELLKSCKLLKESGYVFDCIFVGAWSAEIRKDLFEDLVVQYDLKDHVFIRGPLYDDDKYNVLLESDILIYPTQADCFPLVLLEALSFQLPVVSTVEGAIPEIILNEKNGFLVPKFDNILLTNRIAYLIDNDDVRLNMGIESRKLFEEKYDIEEFHNNFFTVFSHIIDDFER